MHKKNTRSELRNTGGGMSRVEQPSARLGDDADRLVLDRFLSLPDLATALSERSPMHRFLDADCLIGTFDRAAHLCIRAGRLLSAEAGPILMRSSRFAFRATPDAWLEHWKPMPKPGFHDLLAMTKRGVATLEGDLQPFLANLQYFKDLLALLRAERSAGAA
jgi:hypothetical protein